MVAGGHLQLRSSDEDNSSPTVSTEGLLTVLAVSAAKHHHIATADVEGAFLECPMDAEVFMRLAPDISDLLVQSRPSVKPFFRGDGSLKVKLDKALYGTIQASRLWYTMLSNLFVSHGFRMNRYDKCIFYKYHMGENIIICAHVDDVFISSTTRAGADYCLGLMSTAFTAVNETMGPTVEYLGMQISSSDTGIAVSMLGYANDCVNLFNTFDKVGKFTTPSDSNLFVIDDTSPALSESKSKAFHSVMAKVLYLATKTRPDLLTEISFLSSRVTACTEQDWAKLRRMVSYLSVTKHYGLFYHHNRPAAITAYVDASFGTHMYDGTGRTGILLTLAGGAICFKSFKQKCVTLSSTESEIVALAEGSNYVLWLRNLMSDLELTSLGPTVIHQDNKSTIILVNNERTKQQRTRHMNAKYLQSASVSEKKKLYSSIWPA